MTPERPVLAPGSQLGPYQISSLLGSGGMGQVYKAYDARLGRDVAIKMTAERVCRDLGIRHTIQGTVQRMGARWRVSIQLFDTTSQSITFSEKHDFELDNVFDVQDEVGRVVVESLNARFPSSVTKSRDRYSSNPEAYNHFMAGLHAPGRRPRIDLRVSGY